MTARGAAEPKPPEADPEAVLGALARSQEPLVVGVRHHSPVLSAAVPRILDAFAPERVLVELPEEFQSWLPWLGHSELEGPVALGGVRGDASELAFYPFADFSPELAAVRWAVARKVPVEAFDLPLGSRQRSQTRSQENKGTAGLVIKMLGATGAEDFESLWDRLVESRAPGSSVEAIRRAALLLGWALRSDTAGADGIPERDLRRETHMRRRIAASSSRTAVVVGAFHAAALLREPLLFAEVATESGSTSADVVTSLIGYSHELLDSRSGYPAGIRDPVWQERVFRASRDGTEIEGVVTDLVVAVCREIRSLGHVAGFPDAQEAVRLAIDLARLRGLPAPGRRELLESFESALGRGELLGRGRVLARALDRVLVGRRRGRLAPGTPRSGLAPHVEGLLEELRLPRPGAAAREPVTLRLDPLRSDLDRRRVVVLRRLGACAVPYAVLQEQTALGATETLTIVYEVGWSPAVEAMLELAGTRGVTLAQAAAGALRASRARQRADDKETARVRLDGARAAAECGLAELAGERLLELVGPFLREASLVEVLEAHLLLERIERGHEPGLPREGPDAFQIPEGVRRSELLAAALRALEGLAGSEQIEDARAILELVHLFERQPAELAALGGGRLGWALDQLARDGSPLVQGAAGVARVILGRESAAEFGARLGAWVDVAVDPGSRRALSGRLQGTLTVGVTLLESDPTFARSLIERIDALDDGGFLVRLPALREGFDVLAPAARTRLLTALGERLGETLDAALEETPALLARFAAADRAGLEAARRFDSNVDQLLALGAPRETKKKAPEANPGRSGLVARDRWRLILGRERERLTPASKRLANALDELYGRGRGEGSRSDLGPGAGDEESFASVREWAGELEGLFGTQVRQEVLGRAAEHGLGAALLELDPASVTPSVELLEQLLSLKGGLAETQLAPLRQLIARVVEALVQELAARLQPALAGLATPRATRRRGAPLDLRKTIEANLRTVRRREGGSPELVPERLLFKTRARRSLDWHVILVVDVSGSMEASVIHSAIMAAILSALPAFSVNFLAFNTEVIDLSQRVGDPLGLLLEIAVGGGTHIARALRYARELIRVPRRTLVLVVSDFDEGAPVDGLVEEVRAIVESGATALGIAALDEQAKPRFNQATAELVVGAGMPVAALTPLELARWVGEKVR